MVGGGGVLMQVKCSTFVQTYFLKNEVLELDQAEHLGQAGGQFNSFGRGDNQTSPLIGDKVKSIFYYFSHGFRNPNNI